MKSMDRGAFLRSLPFLTPISSEATWPPRISGSSGTNIILKNHVVSIEPKDGGPAYFEPQHGVDPAMFHVDICIVTTFVEDTNVGGKRTSPAASSVSTSLSMSQSPKPPSEDVNEKSRNEKIHVLFHIDGKFVFQVDLAQFRGIELEEKPLNGVPYLKLCFHCCSFRIFSEDSITATDSSDDFCLLKTVASSIKKAVSVFHRLSIFQRSEDYQTPLQDTESTEDRIDGHGQSQVKGGIESNGESASIRRVKRKRTSLARSWHGLQSLKSVLDMPHDAADADDGVLDTIAPILTSSAEELASSYCRKNDLRNAMQSCSNVISSCETQLNDVFASAFPPPRNRRNASPAKMLPPDETTENLLETANLLLKKQKNAMKQRLELSLLPTRE